MNRICLNLALVFILFVTVGCQDQTAVITSDEPVNSTPVVAKTGVVSDVQEQEQQQEETEKEKEGLQASGLLNKAKDMLKQAADSGSTEADIARKWMSEKFGDATESSSEIAEDAAKWASDVFDSLKNNGMTSADNATDWLTQDIRNMNALKYKVVKISLDDLGAVEDQLNQLGKLRWDCFHAVEKDGQTILFFKKERRSVLKNIPVKDMLKLIPLMGDGGGPGE